MVNYIAEIKAAKTALLSMQAKRELCREQLTKIQADLLLDEQHLADSEKARVVVQTVASTIQKNLEFKIANIVTMALASVGFSYEFKVTFVERRNQTECDLMFMKDGNECEADGSASGGGAVDIASLALRMAIWSIKKTRAIQILDEPAKFLSRDMQEKCSEMIKMLSKELGIQMIIVSHIPEMITAADRIINVDNIDGYSVIKEI